MRSAAFGFACLLGTGAAQAQTEEILEPPTIVRFVQATYPPEALRMGTEADVGLSIDVGADGSVVDVHVVHSAGRGFDEAAVEAVRAFVFSPARRGAEAIASRTLYRYSFRLPEPDPDRATELADLQGWITDESGAPAVGARVRVHGPGADVEARTDVDGAFRVRELRAGEYDVDVSGEGIEPFAARVSIVSGRVEPVRYRVRFVRGAYETVVEAAPPESEPNVRAIGADEIRRVPGTNGDALRSVESQPGVARPPLGLGLFIVRGSPPDDTLVLLEDHPVPLPYHLGGLATVVASDLVDRIEFHPGGFGPRYGRISGGVIEMRLRTPRRDRLHASADVDLVDAGTVVEAPVGDHAGIAIGARRSYVDALLPLFWPDGEGLALTQAPRYWDFQVLFDWEPTDDDRVRLLASGSDDVLGLLLTDPGDADPGLRGGISTHFAHEGLQARWTRDLGGGVTHIFSPGVVHSVTEGRVGPSIDFRFESLLLGVRDEVSLPIGQGAGLTVGADLQAGALDTAVRAPPPPDDREAPDPIFGQAVRTYDAERSLLNAGAWAEMDLAAGSRVTLLPGLRVDHLGLLRESTVDPRVRARVRAHPRLSFEGGVGLYSQPPRGYQIVPGFGNPDLRAERAVHANVGFEEQLYGPFDLGALVFVKTLDDAAAPDPDTNFSSDGESRTVGGEWLLRLRPALPAFGWIAYTLSRTHTRDDQGAPWRLGAWDQTHIFTVVLGTAIPGGWELGARYRIASGFPEAPVVGSEFDADFDVHRPVFDPVRMVRLPAFQSLDLRVSKRFSGLGLRWRTWLDVQNVTNRANPESRLYSYDYSESTYLTGLPILPSVGLAAEY